jgi:hypothetical protein
MYRVLGIKEPFFYRYWNSLRLISKRDGFYQIKFMNYRLNRVGF